MTWERDKKKKLAEYLWTEINKAILKSPDVQFSIKKLDQLQLLDYVSEFNLVLEVDKLIESILKQNGEREANSKELDKLKEEFLEAKANSALEELADKSEPENEIEEKETADISSPFSPGPLQIVDGKTLSENEIRFEEYFTQNFDEKHWMKKAKIRFDS
jgi:hypothetical protein